MSICLTILNGMAKVDFTKTLDSYRARYGEFRLLDVPPLRYLMVDGHGDPNTEASYSDALAALYPLAYTLKFASKRELDRDYVVPPLEARWWADDMTAFTTGRDKSQWDWTVMLLVPDWITAEMFATAVDEVAVKKAPDALDQVHLTALDEGHCVQTLHVGPYDEEGPVLQQMHEEFIPGRRLQMTGRHHEIYLGDPRRVAPDRLRTILRQPVRPMVEA